MINAILKGIFKLVISLVNILLTPIDTLINSVFPGISNVLNTVSDFFGQILGFIPYILSWFHLPDYFITFVIGYWVFKLSVPIVVHTVKLAIKWYDKIKP